MVVSVQFFGVQRAMTRTAELEIPLEGQASVLDVMNFIKSSFPLLPLSESDVSITVNNKAGRLNQTLRANDKVAFLPHIGGG
ncbi:MAG: MoaD/ThiS family protein [Deltaproteobacteria bacterium]|nr:MoaD/ThiS family protein [Deltaproteobacteria bacterium]MBW1922990.1 MoaD/ThiS family protein [Deltaproteobacteria bacterium]MBW1951088.1 MoaD/ThiS family protein [Deltaproteobacteria bacterium]MBW2009514.1 MoaD/ThiS family protein [Deltaproteobacteria bacterium]MBW2104020.1 MoaD/ThiS family protein [Deltaproteobacteria bacterium]